VVPPKTHRWIAGLIAEHAPAAKAILPLGQQGTFSPAISDDRRVELVAYERGPSVSTVYLLAWDPDITAAQIDLRTSTSVAEHELAGTTGARTEITVPPAIRRELRDFGFASPPAVVHWMTATFSQRLPDSTEVALHIRLAKDSNATSTVNFFTNSAE
jgi:hypothetical protein